MVHPSSSPVVLSTSTEVARVRPRRLIVMTRIPEVGRVKTRLIPVLGPEGAATLHAALLRKTLHMAEDHGQQTRIDVEVRFTGGTTESMASLPVERTGIWREQQGTDLGDRMHTAIESALKEGATAVLVIGTDCPDLSAERLNHAWGELDHSDIVIGPADDGGYYLIGAKQAEARLFAGVDWGTEHVLRQTQDRCRNLGLSCALLPPLSDVDEAENLVVCRRAEDDFVDCLPRKCAGMLSVIIPTLNEVGQLEATLRPILGLSNCEIIIADGGSTDGTTDLARKLGCRVIVANRGRGRQMNAGAALASGKELLFLHADTQLPVAFREEIRAILSSGAIAGAFLFQIDQPGWGLRAVEWGTNLRSRYLQLPYGDQGLFLRAEDFFRLGGFKSWPLMEDFEMCRRLRRHGQIRIASTAVQTSARRWMRLGIWRTTLINQVCIVGFRLGCSPERLARWYATQREPDRSRPKRWSSLSIRSFLFASVVLLAVAFVYHRQNDAWPHSAGDQHRDTLKQMMEQNRRAFPEADEVDVVKMIELLQQKNCVLVDVRTEAERQVSIIPGAISAAEFERTIKDQTGKTVVCYCTIGYRSAQYAQAMKQRGVSIASFNGSIIAWCQAGQKVTTQNGRDTTRVHVYGPKWNLLPPEYQAVR